jgi:hypothetical protein
MTVFIFKDKKTLFVDFRTETLRTKLERVHFGSGIETRVFFSGKKKVNHYENESTHSTACVADEYIRIHVLFHACIYLHTCTVSCVRIYTHFATVVYMYK